MTVDLRGAAYAASRISSTLKGSTKQFGWLQASATRNYSALMSSEYPATIRIDKKERPQRLAYQEEVEASSRVAPADPSKVETVPMSLQRRGSALSVYRSAFSISSLIALDSQGLALSLVR